MKLRCNIPNSLTAVCLLATLMVASWISVTHHHAVSWSVAEVGGQHDSAFFLCGCTTHEAALQVATGQRPDQDSDSEHCLVCRLLADFHAELAPSFELPYDSRVCLVEPSDLPAVACRSERRARGRAPPIA